MIIVTQPFKDYPTAFYENGVAVAVVTTRRNHPLAISPVIKSTNFLNNILAKIESLKSGAYEGIMLNWEGYVAEGTISNIFTVKHGVLYTPHLDTGILEGVTRDLVLHLARTDHIPTKEIRLKPHDLTSANECFITNTTVEVLPVTRVDGNVIGNGRPGPVTTALREAYQREVARDV